MQDSLPLGHRVVHSPETGSTNDDAKALAADGAPEGTVVRADRQRAGRGRAGRAWDSPAGGLWFSVVLRPAAPPARWGLIPLAVGAGVAAALADVGVDAALKWPNDVLLRGRKVGGVLCESRLGDGSALAVRDPDVSRSRSGNVRAPFVVAGVGLNANVDAAALGPEARAVAATLLEHGGPHDLDALMRRILAAVEARYRALEAGAVDDVLTEYRARCVTIGQRVRTAEGVVGVAVDVGDDGSLEIEKEGGSRVAVRAEDVHTVRGA